MVNIFKWSTQWYSNKNIHTILRLTVWQWILSSVLFQTQRTYSVLKECSRTPGALGRNRTNSSVNSLKAFQSRTTENQRGNNDVSKKVQEIIIIINILITSSSVLICIWRWYLLRTSVILVSFTAENYFLT